ncbi:hypothetical protein ATP06_0237780 [Amycolatopsis regifaucium]|uniref:Uncharacterized protein n=1 Tax=Amycolatopsis regifaucium TaxID=546365 RepID=A0ABX3DFY4_9PSEU|nr:hypothetical protein ATP06_0237780 [Amycolatopsis regifaucium]
MGALSVGITCRAGASEPNTVPIGPFLDEMSRTVPAEPSFPDTPVSGVDTAWGMTSLSGFST